LSDAAPLQDVAYMRRSFDEISKSLGCNTAQVGSAMRTLESSPFTNPEYAAVAE
jgi:hypothetical protein